MQSEVLFVEENRNTLFPIKYQTLWEEYKKQQACFWQAHEVNLTNDYFDWEKLDKDEKFFIKMVLAFFASSDLIVNKNIAENFSKVKILEAQITYNWQETMENIHSEMYSLLIDTYIKDVEEKKYLFNAIENVPIIKRMAEWAYKWMNSDKPHNERLVAFSAYEGILFSGPFCAIYWIKERGVLPGLCLSNDFIARDEGLHVDFAIKTYSLLTNKCSQQRLHEIIKEAVDLEIEFITESLPCKLIGMNSQLMIEYIKYVADRLCLSYGCEKIYDSKQPFTFMDRIGISSKKNFFEKTPTEYSKADNSTKKNAYAFLKPKIGESKA